MPSNLRILVVDDSAVMRRLLSEAIAAEPGLEVVGVAGNGQLALSMIERLMPDLVTLDIEMPLLNGLETLKEIRARHGRLPVIMCSSLTIKGAIATIECLALGASDYVTKPERASSVDEAIAKLRECLIPKIIALCNVGPETHRPSDKYVHPPVNFASPSIQTAIGVVGIGCSTGGPKALAEILPSFPADFPLPIVVVQHMPPVFTQALADRLNSLCPLNVLEAVQGEELVPGKIWIAAGDYHMAAVRDGMRVFLETPQTPAENSCRPSVDVLFRSLAIAYGAHVLAVVLTGMGQDGLRGCTQLAAAGAQIIVQDEASSVVWGMPGFVAKAGLAHAILPLAQITSRVVMRVNASRTVLV